MKQADSKAVIDSRIKNINSRLTGPLKKLALVDLHTMEHGISAEEYSVSATKGEIPFLNIFDTDLHPEDDSNGLYVSASVYIDRWEFKFTQIDIGDINAIVIHRRELPGVSSEEFIDQMLAIFKLTLSGQIYSTVSYIEDATLRSDLMIKTGDDERTIDYHVVASSVDSGDSAAKTYRNSLISQIDLPKEFVLLRQNRRIKDTLLALSRGERRKGLAIAGVLFSIPALFISISLGNQTRNTGFFWLASVFAFVTLIGAVVAFPLKATAAFVVSGVVGVAVLVAGTVAPIALVETLLKPHINPTTYDQMMPFIIVVSILIGVGLSVLTIRKLQAKINPQPKLSSK